MYFHFWNKMTSGLEGENILLLGVKWTWQLFAEWFKLYVFGKSKGNSICNSYKRECAEIKV